MPFTLGVAYTSAVAILITQLDKVILSRVLSLDNFGYLALVLLITTSVTGLAQPIGKAVLPRITFLIEKLHFAEMQKIYFSATQLTAVIVLPAVGFLVVYSNEVLYLWSGNQTFANWGENVLIWYALGAGVAAMNTFQYYLQCAFGSIKLHVLGTTTTAIIQIPFIIYSATEYGALGAGIVWFTFRLLYFLIWTPVVHAKFLKGLHLRWLLQEIGPVLILVVSISYLADRFIQVPLDKGIFIPSLYLFSIATCFVLSAAATSSVIRTHLVTKFSVWLTG
jgi:O-antigen/teichoic acid export membrane protein